MLILSLLLVFVQLHHHVEVTYYIKGKKTADGSPFNPKAMTCAVREFNKLHHWITIHHDGKKVTVWSNDLMSEKASAEYDLTPAAFMKLAPLHVGRLRDVEVDIEPNP